MNTIEKEKNDAEEKYGHFNSTHEVYGVLLEEVDEFWDLVRLPCMPGESEQCHKKNSMIHELTQIAAIAERAIEELGNNKIRWI